MIIREELPLFRTELNDFKELTSKEVKDMVFKSPNKFCELNPAPTWIIRDYIEEVLPLVTKITNLSLTCGEMTDDLKLAIIKPMLKKLGLDLIKQDTIDHKILFNKIEKRCGIKGNVLKFLKSYLTDRKQKVIINDNESTT